MQALSHCFADVAPGQLSRKGAISRKFPKEKLYEDPLPKIAGVASSILGTLQNTFGAAGALIGAAIYNGSVRNSVIIIGCAGVLASIVFLLRPLLVPGGIVSHPDQLARD